MDRMAGWTQAFEGAKEFLVVSNHRLNRSRSWQMRVGSTQSTTADRRDYGDFFSGFDRVLVCHKTSIDRQAADGQPSVELGIKLREDFSQRRGGGRKGGLDRDLIGSDSLSHGSEQKNRQLDGGMGCREVHRGGCPLRGGIDWMGWGQRTTRPWWELSIHFFTSGIRP